MPSRFLSEVPPSLCQRLSRYHKSYREEVDLFAEQDSVRESVKRNLYTGRTYNSVDNIKQYFSERGMPAPSGLTRRPAAAPPKPQPAASARPAARGFRQGAVVEHPKYGRGTVIRREGDGEDAKLTIHFPGYGLKKIVEKYAGIKIDR